MEQIETSGGTEAILELINMVRQDPRLWDRNSPNFITHYDVKIDRFANIASQLNLPGVNGEIVTSAWRELSEKYRRRLYDGKRRNGTTSWPFFEPMSFLRDQYE
uniref:MADF domain-containing protein n=2 Tax=Ascarididae TaxID=6250 RepID=A0A914R4W5_PAREQ